MCYPDNTCYFFFSVSSSQSLNQRNDLSSKNSKKPRVINDGGRELNL